MGPGSRASARARVARAGAVVATLVVMLLVVWIDISTDVWADVVVLSGIAAGLLTFLLTALLLDRLLARAEHGRWIPVTRLALTDMLHALAHDDSEITIGKIEPRRLEEPDGSEAATRQLLAQVVVERDDITAVLARWASFLAASADVETLMTHVAAIAVELDAIRDVVVEAEQRGTGEPPAELGPAIGRYNGHVVHAITEIQGLLAEAR